MKPGDSGGKAERSEQMKKSLVAVFIGVMVWFVLSNVTGVGKVTIYNVSDFIAPFYVQLGDVILYLLFGTLIYTSGIFIFHLHTFQKSRKTLNGKSDRVRAAVRNLFVGHPESEESREGSRAERLWQTVKAEKDSPYGDVLEGLSEEDLRSKQDFVHALEVRVGDMTAQRKQVLSFYNYISITAPTLGFLGTAVGMVAIFDDVGVAGAEQLAADLKIALITTVVGLGIRFVALFCKTILESLQEDLSVVMVSELKEMLA
jgi:biopolymer transport protein ExbB/TolQ